MDTEMRLHYIEIERSSEAARLLRIADARAHLPGRRRASALRLEYSVPGGRHAPEGWLGSA